MEYKLEFNHPCVYPALILTFAAIPGIGVQEDTLTAGTAFFISKDWVATAFHIGESIRSNCALEKMHEKGGKQPYGMQLFSPHYEFSWKIVDECPLKGTDISLLKVEPLVNNEEESGYMSWRQVMDDFTHSDYPIIRLFPVVEGEILEFRGYSNIDFTDTGKTLGAAKQIEVDADGDVRQGRMKNDEIESKEGVKTIRPLIEGVSALPLNSGSPVIDEKGRIVGVVSKSPEESAELKYTVFAPFASSEFEGPSTAGIYQTSLKLVCSEDGQETTLTIKGEFQP